MITPLTPLRVRRSPLATLLLLVYLPACTSWHVGTPTPSAFVQREHPQRARVTRTDGTQLMLKEPAVLWDTLLGTLDNHDTIRVTLPLSQVQSVAVRKFSAEKTILVVGGVLGVVVVAWLIDCSGRSGLSAIGCP